MRTEVVKGKSIEGLVGRYSPKKVEEEKEVENNPNIAAALSRYQEWINSPHDDLVQINEMDIILTPLQIKSILEVATSSNHHLHRNYSGYFISKLVQNSYDEGYNNFNFSWSGELYSLPYRGKGTEERPLFITIRGDVGFAFANYNEHSIITLHGYTQYRRYGDYARNCTFKTSKMKTLFYFLRDISTHNEVIFIHRDGSEELVTELREFVEDNR